MIVLCQCGKVLTTEDIKLEASNFTDKQGNEIQEVYYIKPCCNVKEHIAYTDEICLALQNEIRNARDSKDIVTARALVKRLKTRMDIINSKDIADGN